MDWAAALIVFAESPENVSCCTSDRRWDLDAVLGVSNSVGNYQKIGAKAEGA